MKVKEIQEGHWHFSDKNKIISLIYLRQGRENDSLFDIYKTAPYEIYCIKGKMFWDCKKYLTKTLAIKAVKRYLNTKKTRKPKIEK